MKIFKFGVITLFPDMFKALDFGITGKAISNNIIEVSYWNPRDFSQDKHLTVDDRPYGGGPGMVMMVQPLLDAINAAKQTLGTTAKVIYLSPQGKVLNHAGVERLSATNPLIFVAGRYEGIDERLIALAVDEQWSIGDYVLTGGEFAAMTIIDAITRLQPGALGHEESAKQDSFVQGLLDHPHYTRPEEFAGIRVPDILLSGNHQAIARWRLKQALGRTWQNRPDLIADKTLSAMEQALLDEFKAENEHE